MISPRKLLLIVAPATLCLGGVAALLSAPGTYWKVAVPPPTGPSRVGTRVLRMVDPARNDPFVADGTKRELLVRFWYPAAIGEACQPAEYTSPGVWKYFSELAGLPLPAITTNSCLNSRVGDGLHPVVVFTHGYTGTFTDYTFIFEELASRGYVVASVSHPYESTAVEFPDGRLIKSIFGSYLAANTLRSDDQSLSFALSVRLADLRFVVDELHRLNTVAASPFSGSLDLSRIALAGHSMGGLATLLEMQQDARFKAGVIIDGDLSDAHVANSDRPFLILAAGREQWSEPECALWRSLHGPRLAVNLKGAEHLTVSDAVWLTKYIPLGVRTGSMGPQKTMAAVRSFVAAFLDANIRGKPFDPLMTGRPSEYSDAVVTSQKQGLCGEVVADVSRVR